MFDECWEQNGFDRPINDIDFVSGGLKRDGGKRFDGLLAKLGQHVVAHKFADDHQPALYLFKIGQHLSNGADESLFAATLHWHQIGFFFRRTVGISGRTIAGTVVAILSRPRRL